MLHDGWLLLIAMVALLIFSLRLTDLLPQEVAHAFGRIF
jgi:hypothetical protein